jgi:heme/copper-type cytochrome/quinol oxidase subunit 1
MKSTLVFLFLLFISLQSFAQASFDRALYQEKLAKYHRMKKTGTTLTVLGTALSVVGLITIANTSTTTTYTYGSPQTKVDGNPGLGIAAYLGGSICVGIGVPLWIVGGVNKGKYERKLQSLNVGANITPQGARLTFRYRF